MFLVDINIVLKIECKCKLEYKTLLLDIIGWFIYYAFFVAIRQLDNCECFNLLCTLFWFTILRLYVCVLSADLVNALERVSFVGYYSFWQNNY